MTEMQSPGDVAEPSPELATLYERIAKGVEWLTEHDPTGAFHLWYESKISPSARMPAQDEERRADYRGYYTQREHFANLWRAMVRLERAELAKQKGG